LRDCRHAKCRQEHTFQWYQPTTPRHVPHKATNIITMIITADTIAIIFTLVLNARCKLVLLPPPSPESFLQPPFPPLSPLSPQTFIRSNVCLISSSTPYPLCQRHSLPPSALWQVSSHPPPPSFSLSSNSSHQHSECRGRQLPLLHHQAKRRAGELQTESLPAAGTHPNDERQAKPHEFKASQTTNTQP
jgi:hypothetical protein